LKKLYNNNISSIPIFDTDETRYNSFFDNVDAVTYLVQYCKTNQEDQNAEIFFETTYSKDVFGPYYKNWSNTFVTNVADTNSLKRALDISVNMSDLHRLPVFNITGELCGLLSQSQLVYSLAPFIHLFPLSNNTIHDLNLGLNTGVISVDIKQPLLTALTLISTQRISGLAVVNGETLVGNFSASDMRHIGILPSRAVLNTSMGEIQLQKKKPIVVFPQMTVKQVVDLIAQTRIHRVYIVANDNSMKLLGSISLIDILSLISKYL